MDAHDIAVIVHEANRVYCQSQGDNTQMEWIQTPPPIQNSAINGVEFFLANPDTTPEDMHANWMKEKIAAKWIYGEEKNTFRKTHPCIVPYMELPEAQKMKDKLFMAICEVLQHAE